MILERCLELLENTREEREALDLRDWEAIRPLLPITGPYARVMDSYDEGVITAREAVHKCIVDEPEDGAIEDQNLLVLWDLVRTACLATDGILEDQAQTRHYVRAIRAVLAEQPFAGEDGLWEAMIDFHRFAETTGHPRLAHLEELLSREP